MGPLQLLQFKKIFWNCCAYLVKVMMNIFSFVSVFVFVFVFYVFIINRFLKSYEVLNWFHKTWLESEMCVAIKMKRIFTINVLTILCYEENLLLEGNLIKSKRKWNFIARLFVSVWLCFHYFEIKKETKTISWIF